jgi:hypothetical protein
LDQPCNRERGVGWSFRIFVGLRNMPLFWAEPARAAARSS